MDSKQAEVKQTKLSIVPPAKVNKKQTFSKMVSFCRPEIPRISLGLAALAVNSVTNLSFPWILGKAVDRLADRSSRDAKLFFVGSASLFMLGGLASWIRVYCIGTSTTMIAARLRQLLFESYMDKDMDYFDASTTGEALTLLEKDVNLAAGTLTETLSAALRSMNSAFNGSLLLLYTSPKLCAVSLSIVPLIGIGAMSMSKFAKKMAQKLRALESQMTSFSLERLTGISTVKLNGREDHEKSLYGKLVNSSIEVSKSSDFAQGAFMGFINLATNFSLLAVLHFGGGLIAQGELTAGSLTQFAIQSGFVGLGFSGLSTAYSDLVKCLDAASRIFDTIESQKKSIDDDVSVIPKVPVTPKATNLIRGISIENVSFRYNSRSDNAVLTNLNLELKPKALTVVVGKSGSGKSTILSLLSGLYRPSSGDITVEGESIFGHSAQWLRSMMGIVEQQPILLSGSIRDNIAYGKEDASEEDIINAAKIARAHDFIMSFPNGYDTEVGERGSLLSGGQCARIALARALVKDPPILLLDEVTAALDQENETAIVKVLDSLRGAKTIICFTHSESFMKLADVIHVMKDGQIVEQGTYQDLSQSKGHFWEIIESK